MSVSNKFFNLRSSSVIAGFSSTEALVSSGNIGALPLESVLLRSNQVKQGESESFLAFRALLSHEREVYIFKPFMSLFQILESLFPLKEFIGELLMIS